jgi:LPS sulfotransferase NodH
LGASLGLFGPRTALNVAHELRCLKANVRLAGGYLRGLALSEPISPFLLFGLQRSGATFFGDLLAQHPGLTWAGEISVQQAYFPALHLRRLAAATSAARPGFKVFPFQLSRKREVPKDGYGQLDIVRGRRTLDKLASKNWKFINLQRRDILAQCVSLTRALQTGFWHARSELQDDTEQQTQLDLQLFEQNLTALLAFRRYEAELFSKIEIMRVSYENDLENLEAHQATANAAFRLLGVPEIPVSTRFIKIAQRPLSTRILNYEEIARIAKRLDVRVDP